MFLQVSLSLNFAVTAGWLSGVWCCNAASCVSGKSVREAHAALCSHALQREHGQDLQVRNDSGFQLNLYQRWEEKVEGCASKNSQSKLKNRSRTCSWAFLLHFGEGWAGSSPWTESLSLVLPSLTCPYYSLTYLCMEALLLGLFLTNHCVWNSGRESCRKNNWKYRT